MFLYFYTLACSFVGTPCIVGVTALLPAPCTSVLCVKHEGVAPPPTAPACARKLVPSCSGTQGCLPQQELWHCWCPWWRCLSLAELSLAEVSLLHVQESLRGKAERCTPVSAWDATVSCESLHNTKTASQWDFLKAVLSITVSPSWT